jgi:hypothetical protein
MFYVFTHHSSITPARFSCRDSGWSHGFKLGDQRTSLTPERDANCFTNWGGELSCAEARQLTSNRHSFPAYIRRTELNLHATVCLGRGMDSMRRSRANLNRRIAGSLPLRIPSQVSLCQRWFKRFLQPARYLSPLPDCAGSDSS